MVNAASFSSSFSPGAVDTTLSNSICDSAARFAVSIIRTSALNNANTAQKEKQALIERIWRDERKQYQADDQNLSAQLAHTPRGQAGVRGTEYDLQIRQMGDDGRRVVCLTSPRRYPVLFTRIVIIRPQVVTVRWSKQKGPFFVTSESYTGVHHLLQLRVRGTIRISPKSVKFKRT